MTKNAEDYALENINLAMVALLEHLGREEAVWIGKYSLSFAQGQAGVVLVTNADGTDRA